MFEESYLMNRYETPENELRNHMAVYKEERALYEKAKTEKDKKELRRLLAWRRREIIRLMKEVQTKKEAAGVR